MFISLRYRCVSIYLGKLFYLQRNIHTHRHAVISPRMHLDIVSPAFVSRMKRWCLPSSLSMLLWSCLWCRTNLTPDVPVIPSDMGVDFSSILEAFWAFQCFHYIDQRGHDLWFPAHVFGAENNIYEMWMWVWPNNILDSWCFMIWNMLNLRFYVSNICLRYLHH